MEFASLFPRASIYAFEGDCRSVALFKQVAAARDAAAIELTEKAVGAVDGEVSWYPSDSATRRHYTFQDYWSASSSLQPPNRRLSVFPDVHFQPPVTVPCTPLDSWVREMLDCGEIDLAWVDLNGGEGEVLRGGEHTFRERIRFAYIEFCVHELYEGALEYEGVLSLLPQFAPLGVCDFRGNFGSVILRNDARKA